MKSFIAIISGSLFIIISSIVFQLAIMIAMVVYKHIEKDYPFLDDFIWLVRYLVGFPVFFLLMAVGGYITAYVEDGNEIRNCLLVGLLTSSGMLWLATENAVITITGMVVFVLMNIATIAGGMIWLRKYGPTGVGRI